MAAAAIGAIAGAALPIAGDYMQIRGNKEMQQDQNQFSERMSSSAYQRAVEDMRKAGLNPMLAYSQGGASTPTASQYSGTPNFGADAVAGVSSALASVNQLSQIKNTEAQNAQINAQTDQVRAQTLKTAGETAQQVYQNAAIKASTKNTDLDSDLKELNQRLVQANTQIARQSAKEQMWRMIPEFNQAQQEYRSNYGKSDAFLNHVLRAIPFLNFSAKSAQP